MKRLLETIESHLPEGGDWCDLDKATQLAALIVACRPRVVLEIGVWMGGSLIPMALAVQYNAGRGHPGKVIGIDPWSMPASVVGQSGDHLQWWEKQDHERAYQVVIERILKHDLGELVEIRREPSDDSAPPAEIDILHVDGNHSEQAVRDVRRFGSRVRIGGFMVLDDLEWEGGAVSQARTVALNLGFADCYKLGTGIVMLRTRTPSVF